MIMGSKRLARHGLAALALSGALVITGLPFAHAQDNPDAGGATAAAPGPDGAAGPGGSPAPGSTGRGFGHPNGRGDGRDFREFQEFRDWQQFQRFERWERWQDGRRRGRGMGMGMGAGFGPAMGLERPLLGAFRRLDLSAQQWQQVRQELMNARQAQHRTPAQPDRLRALLDPSEAGHAQAVQEAKDRAVARIEQAAQLQQRLYQILTPQQQQRFKQMLAQAPTTPRWHSFGRGPTPFRRGGTAGQGAPGAEQAPAAGTP